MASWGQLQELLADGFIPVFGSNPLFMGILVTTALFIALNFWGAGLEASVAIMSLLVILLVSTTNALPTNVGYLVILIMLIPTYWAMRGFFSR